MFSWIQSYLFAIQLRYRCYLKPTEILFTNRNNLPVLRLPCSLYNAAVTWIKIQIVAP